MFGVAGALLLVTGALFDAPSAISAAGLLAALLLVAVADPPTRNRSPRARAVGRLAAGALALAMGTATVIATLNQGFAVPAHWQAIAIVSAGASALLLAPLVALRRASSLDAPVRRAERTTLLRGSAVTTALAAATLVSAFVLSAVGALVAIAFGLLVVLEGVALMRPGGAGIRRVPTDAELAAIVAVLAHGPGEALGYRRIVVRSTGAADYLSVEVLIRDDVPALRRQAIRDSLEQSIRLSLPDVVASVNLHPGP